MRILRHEGEHLTDILILAEAHHAGQRTAICALTQLRRHEGHSVGVVPRITDHHRLLFEHLPATSKRGYTHDITQTLDKGSTCDCKRRILVQIVRRSTYYIYVLALIFAQQPHSQRIWLAVTSTHHIEELLVSFEHLTVADKGLLGIDYLRAHIRCNILYHKVIGRILFAHNHRHTLLDNATLLTCNLWQRVAQQRRMVEPHVGDDAQGRDDDIRSVEASTEPRLNNRHLDIALCEVVEGQGGSHLEEGEVALLHILLIFIYEVGDLLLGYHLAIDTDTLTEVAQVRRGIESRLVSRLLQYRSEHIRYRALAVGAGNVDDKVVTLWIAELAAKLRHTLQSGLVGGCSMCLKGRQRVEQIIYCLLIVHSTI